MVIIFPYFGVIYTLLLSLLAVWLWDKGLYQLGIFMVPFLIRFWYNGESGSKKQVHKWFFYIFYPVHLLVLGVCMKKAISKGECRC